MFTSTTSIRLAPHLDELPRLMNWAETTVGKVTSSMSIKLKLQLVLEELFLNSVNHGRTGNDVEVSLTTFADEVLVSYVDFGSWYDAEQLSANAESETYHSVEERSVGGLGLLLVYQLPLETVYHHENGQNRFMMKFALKDDADPS